MDKLTLNDGRFRLKKYRAHSYHQKRTSSISWEWLKGMKLEYQVLLNKGGGNDVAHVIQIFCWETGKKLNNFCV